ncbi:fluoride efflux transporter CrcB [Streptosporangium sp. NPDC051022]|uniref:fluoride efflux transporter CrcB n=1 Tax=Streptosporangium sp. NPDC051022 TaxID=3155752 RepID=UPI003413DBAD
MSSDQMRFVTVTDPVDPDADPPVPRERREPRRSRDLVSALVALAGPHRHTLAVVALGGAIGASARYGAALLWPTAAGAFPWTTLVVNTAGCLVIGILLVILTEAWTAPAWVRPFFATGVLGGFTTFSTYCVEIERLVSGGNPDAALVYLVATVLAAMAAVTVGARGTRRLLAARTARRTR